MITTYLAPATAVVGALLFGLAKGKAEVLGKIAFAVGLAATLYFWGSHGVKLP